MKLDSLINEYYDCLNENDRYIWSLISQNRKQCAKMTVNELAAFCSVSRTTIIRFARKLGLEGFSELKFVLKRENQREAESGENILEKVFQEYLHAMKELKEKDFTRICELIYKSDRIFVYGSGDIQNQAANHLKRNFLSTGDVVYHIDGTNIHDEFYEIVTPNDLIILLSLDGESKNIVETARRLTFHGVSVISISKLKNSALARTSTENIYYTTATFDLPNLSGKNYETTAILYYIVELLFVQYNLYKRSKLQSVN